MKQYLNDITILEIETHTVVSSFEKVDIDELGNPIVGRIGRDRIVIPIPDGCFAVLKTPKVVKQLCQ